jgi:hypothetical protein
MRTAEAEMKMLNGLGKRLTDDLTVKGITNDTGLYRNRE